MQRSKPLEKAIEIAKRNELIGLVRKVAKHYGESEENFKEFIADILTKDRDVTLQCFRELVEQLKWMPQIRMETGQG